MNKLDAEAGAALVRAINDLERWKGARKGRHVRIDHDDGFGASCWEVTLGVGSLAVKVTEPIIDDDWGGLVATIDLALRKAAERDDL